jgi:glycosyltransferase involved in cell wall biosynthesis
VNNKLSVVMACYNEDRYIASVVSKVLAQPQVAELIIVDDASSDKSFEILQSFNDSRLVLIQNISNQGKGYCIRKAIELARMEIIGIQDADLEYDPQEYSRLLKPFKDGKADAVFGSRFLTYDSRRVLFFWHRLGNKFLTTLTNLVTNLDLTDMETCFKFFHRDFAKRLDIQEKRFGLEPEITIKLARMNARIYEVPISYNGRTYEEGKKIGWKDGIAAIFCILKYAIKA